MKAAIEIKTPEDLVAINQGPEGEDAPRVLTIKDIMASHNSPATSLLQDLPIPNPGAFLIPGLSKSGKTLLSTQLAIAVASGAPFCDQFPVLMPGPVLMLEQDDPAGLASIRGILERSPVSVEDIPFHLVERVPYEFGDEFVHWLRSQIDRYRIRLVILDSYTALRGPRGKGIDIVKAEQADCNRLDTLAKSTGSSIGIIHHGSKGSSHLDWTLSSAGTFAMTAATEGQVHISRFSDLSDDAPERLIRVRGRHHEDVSIVLRFRPQTLDFEFVLKGDAASLYPTILQIQKAFPQETFSPKKLTHATGWGRATVHRQINRLHSAGALEKRGYGSYVVAAATRPLMLIRGGT